MATRRQLEYLAEELKCCICLELLNEPVVLECGHDFCRPCITRSWAGQEGGQWGCPQCRAVSPCRKLRSSLSLASLSRKVRELQLQPESPRGEEADTLWCPDHQQEALKLLCETDGQLCCLLCRDSGKHRHHRFLLLGEAQPIYKERLKLSLNSATRRKLRVLRAKLMQKQEISKVKEQSSSLQAHITSEFAKMHEFLTRKEQCLLGDLSREEERILNAMEKALGVIQQELDCAEREISDLEARMNQEDTITFLEVEASQKISIADKKYSTLPFVDEGLSLGVFKGPLQYTAWKEMIDYIDPDAARPAELFQQLLFLFLIYSILSVSRKAPASLTLDPNTANPWLVVSEERTGVRLGDRWQDASDNPERFDQCVSLLASEGFTSGRHYWEVEVGEKTEWDLGVVAESANRKGDIAAAPEDGYWIMWLINGTDCVACTSSPTHLNVPNKPRRIGVLLDYDGGQVSFYNAGDMSHLHTFTHTFMEKLYPYFSPGLADGGKNTDELRICPVRGLSSI
ncbi:zinc-binding protein A33-like isoform X2 [Stegostoma tigrinum]|uniref:zinc-binding protein A33-like isoform X2 n=1 Tax=Stegostoma tigrinum TaxID=3053191 RepID=UPI002870222A|nr:zinc-binding protein A33-like isoform X2 [Stegostoma tigrinum]XP_059495355.1 zinc-binding protein A33-like isoform X2 [Stegostoma tigrinum]XP_059495356.1 zinc-binding protein A33-like isoform X2 [Stegostoma tigrinum]